MKGLISFFENLLEESGIKKDLIFIYKNTPKDIKILIFLLLFIISFLYFFIVLFIAYFYFFFFFIYLLKIKIKKEEKTISIVCNNDYDNSLLFFYKELVINYAKTKAFLSFYNFLKILNKKKNKNVNIKILIFTYFFKRIFKFITFIPFIILKINCTIYKRLINMLKLNKNNQSSFKAIIDNTLLNLYIDGISDEIKNIQDYKIIIKKNYIEFNPPKPNRFVFKDTINYFSKKKDIEDMSDFAMFKNKKEENNFIFRHICKIYKVFREDEIFKKNVIFTETKSSKIVDKYGNEIKSKLSDVGSKDSKIITNKMGPIVTENERKGVLDELKAEDIKAVAKSKNKFS